MTRVKRGIMASKRRKKIFSLAKGYKWLRKNVFKQAKQAVLKAAQNAYVGRKQKKRDFRSLWITRISSALLAHGVSYSRFMHALQSKHMLLNRKSLAELAAQHPAAFADLVNKVMA